MSAKTKDFTHGPLFFPIFLFAVPIILTGLLQMCYNMADQIVVGQFSGDPNALAAVGSTSSFSHLIINLAIGLSTGGGVVVAHHFGAHDGERVCRTVHTSFLLALIGGLFLCALGLIISRPVLVLMKTNGDIFESALLYIRIVFLGIPALALYNFGAATLRSVGDSRTPLILLALSGLVNVGLNLFFVIACHLSVAGVALATIISQYVSALAVWIILARREGDTRFSLRRVCLDRRIVRDILRIGIPSGVQGSLFSVSNMLLQSAVNTFPVETISGNTIGGSVEGLTYTAMNGFYQASLTVTGQNVGAGERRRVTKTLLYSLVQVVLVGVLVGALCLVFCDQIARLFIDSTVGNLPAVLAATRERNTVILATYFLCGAMEVLTGHLRGRGCSIIPMISSVVGTVVLRSIWVMVFFPMEELHSLSGLFLCYPISWVVVCILHVATSLFLNKRDKKRQNREKIA